jgi:hypothetical protein
MDGMKTKLKELEINILRVDKPDCLPGQQV